jgi:heterodisulfide reductase subunit A2
MNDSVLILGGGIAGIQAALDLAAAGVRVVLVEKAATLGGKMAVLDKNFPTLDCSICIEAPKMSEVKQHGNIELLTLTELIGLEGAAGNFQATLRQQSRYVTDECTRCNDCVTACPVVLSNEFDSGMGYRKAIYTPIAQAVPGAYLLDLEHCLNTPPNYMPCNRCVEACGPKCIDFEMPPERTLTRQISSIIVATGFHLIRPELIKEFGYGAHPDIITSLELERLLTSAGPTGGEVIKPSNGRHPESVLLVLCAGSRDKRFYQHCSRFCCMYSAKHAFQLIDHGIKDVTVLYLDRRAYGKGFDEFWQRTEESGAKFIRGRPASILPNGDHTLQVRYENTASGALATEHFDLVVLATAVRPPEGLSQLAALLEIELAPDGFIHSVEARGGLLHTTRPGVYVAGCASGPKDIPDSVAEAGAAASLALGHVSNRTWPVEENAEPIENIEEPRIGVFVCHCGTNIAGVIDVKRVARFASELPQVLHSQTQLFSCAGSTQKEIEQIIRDKQLSRVVVAACSPKTHEAIFKGVCLRAGLNPYLLEMVNLRNQDSWVHKEEKELATFKAMDMVRMGVEKARRLQPLHPESQPVVPKALVIGGGVSGMAAASALAKQGFETHLVEKERQLGGVLWSLAKSSATLAPSDLQASSLLQHLETDIRQNGVKVHLGAQVEQAGGYVGNFHARLSTGEELQAGAIILAMGAVPYRPAEFNYSQDPRVITNFELEHRLHTQVEFPDSITFIGCIGSRHDGIGCSRYCCSSMIGQALRLRRLGRKVRVLYKDLRAFSRGAEEQFSQACREGVQFFPYSPTQSPEHAIQFDQGLVSFHDQLLQREVRIPTGLLVLVTGIRPPEESVSEQLKIGRSRDGFLLELHPKLGPAETASQGIYLAGAVQGAKDARESIALGLAAASKASALLAKGQIDKEPLTAKVFTDVCVGCMLCVKVCPFSAIEQLGKVKEGKVKIHSAACMGCGTCAAQCNFDAIEMPYFTKDQVLAQIEAALQVNPEEKVLVFACNWCSYAGADQAGIEKVQYPPSSRVIRTMCSARIEKDFVTRAFDLRAGAVVLTGCRLTEKGSDCHYNHANQHTLRRFKAWKVALERKGVAPERFHLEWISASEGKEFAATMRKMDAIARDFAHGLAGAVPSPI